MIVSSLSNPRIKFLRKLRNRKARQESGLFLIEGIRLVVEAIKQSADIEMLVVAPDLLESTLGKELVAAQMQLGKEIIEVSPAVFESFSCKEGPQGIAAVARQEFELLEEIIPQEDDLWIALDCVADPGNLGTILRTGDAVGARGVFLLDDCVDAFDPGAVRASMGAIFTQKIIRAEWAQFSAWKAERMIHLVGTSGAASLDYARYDYPNPMVLLMGSERQGLQQHHIALCDAVVSIPMQGFSDSLNLSVATAVVVYAIYNQKRFLHGC